MNCAPNQLSKQKSQFPKRDLRDNKSNSQHGDVSQAFNPLAKEFVPGNNVSNGSKQSKSSHGVSKGNVREAHASNARGISRKGERVSSGREGGLSRALKSGSLSPKDVSSQKQDEQSSAQKQNSSNAEANLFGRSPSRTFHSANHLLNFQSNRSRGGGRGFSSVRERGRARGAQRSEPYDRNKFLQANFRFLVSNAADLRAHRSDADLMLDWGDVIEVEMLVNQPLKCPISLESPPLCPQITPCGHVFAFPSIMAHLMSHGGDSLRKASPCPLCNAAIVARELRLVRAHVTPPIKVGDNLEFKLLKRDRKAIIAEHASLREGSKKLQSTASSHSGPSTSRQSRDGRVQKAWQSGTVASDESKGRAGLSILEQLNYNHYSKFTQIEDAPLLWKEAAETLAGYASEVTMGGGPDAAQEAPFIYAAMDALANRAASWAERRQRLLQDRNVAEIHSLSPQEAAQAAAAEVKQITNATVISAGERRRRVEQERQAEAAEQQRMTQFPSLASKPPPAAPLIVTGKQWPAGDQVFEPAFSDDDDLQHMSLSNSPEQGQPVFPPSATPRDPITEAGSAAASEQPMETSISAAQTKSLLAAPQPPVNEFYFYQAVDGQWAFLHPLLTRILLSHYGSYEALPGSLQGRLLELDLQVQSEALRKRHKFLGHLPLGGLYSLAEIDLKNELPADILQPFAADLAARAARREARAAEQSRQDAIDAERAESMLKSQAGPSAAELKAMPLPGQLLQTGRTESEDVEEAVALSLIADTGAGSPAPPQSGISFAHMTRMGYAATGPGLSSTPPNQAPPVWGPPLGAVSASASPGSFPPRTTASIAESNAWGPRQSGTLASRLAEAEAEKTQNPKGRVDTPGGKGKKSGKQLVVLGMQNRRY